MTTRKHPHIQCNFTILCKLIHGSFHKENALERERDSHTKKRSNVNGQHWRYDSLGGVAPLALLSWPVIVGNKLGQDPVVLSGKFCTMAAGQANPSLRPRACILAVAMLLFHLTSADGEMTGGISSLGGVQMQENVLEAQARQRGTARYRSLNLCSTRRERAPKTNSHGSHVCPALKWLGLVGHSKIVLPDFSIHNTVIKAHAQLPRPFVCPPSFQRQCPEAKEWNVMLLNCHLLVSCMLQITGYQFI